MASRDRARERAERADGQRRVVSVGVVVSFMIDNRHRIRAEDVCGSRALLPRLVFVVSDCHAILAFIARSSVLTSGCGPGDRRGGDRPVPGSCWLWCVMS
jgi:hypothetical protein